MPPAPSGVTRGSQGGTGGGTGRGVSGGAGADMSGGAGGGPGIGTSAGSSPSRNTDQRRSDPRPIIAVARDEAFCFYYPENLELLIEEGAAVEFFSPLRGERPGSGAAGAYLGGGYPELHGSALTYQRGVVGCAAGHACGQSAHLRGMWRLHGADGRADRFGWAYLVDGGLLPGFARMSGKLVALGYRYATALRPNLLAEPGDSLRGHEFRYSSWVRDTHFADDTVAWQLKGTRGEVPSDAVGYVRGNLLASYLHVHFGQRRELAERFVQVLRRTD